MEIFCPCFNKDQNFEVLVIQIIYLPSNKQFNNRIFKITLLPSFGSWNNMKRQCWKLLIILSILFDLLTWSRKCF